MSQQIPATEQTDETTGNSRKREITATVVSTVVVVVAGVIASGAINKFGSIVRNRIAPQPEDNESE